MPIKGGGENFAESKVFALLRGFFSRFFISFFSLFFNFVLCICFSYLFSWRLSPFREGEVRTGKLIRRRG
jgi:hypothetical protein